MLFTTNFDAILSDNTFDPFKRLSCFEGEEDSGQDLGGTSEDETDTSDDDQDDEADGGSEDKKPVIKKDIPKARFDKVNKEYRKYKDLGFSPDEVREMALAYNQLLHQQKASKQGSEQGTRKTPNFTSEQRAQYLERLEEVIPGISKISRLLDRVDGLETDVDATKQDTWARNMQRASDRVSTLLKDANYDTKDKKFVEQVEVQVAALVQSDPKLMAMIQKGDLKAVDLAFKGFAKDFLNVFATGKKLAPKLNIPKMMKESEGLSSKKTEIKEEDLSPRERANREKKKDEREFYELYKQLERDNQGD